VNALSSPPLEPSPERAAAHLYPLLLALLLIVERLL
jgi:hypothetical protein